MGKCVLSKNGDDILLVVKAAWILTRVLSKKSYLSLSAICNCPVLRQLQHWPKSLPALVLILASGSLLVLLRSHHVTPTLSPSAANSASTDSAVVVLLRFIFSPNFAPLSV